MTQSARPLLTVVMLFLVVGGVAGGLVGDRVLADSKKPDDQLWAFGEMVSIIEEHYVGELKSAELVEDAIEGMLNTLDPHSNYLNPESFGEMRDEQRGKFHGLGIQITKRGTDKPLTIIAPIDDTPAARAGLQSGDVISHIEGQATMELTVQEAVRLLKGDKGTRVKITIQRPGLDDPFDVTIERDVIPIQSVRSAYMVNDEVGVVRISTFNSTTAEELDQAIAKLGALGLRKLIVDLRGNPGGLLDQAVEVSERFLQPGQKIVETKGRIRGSAQDFHAKSEDVRIGLPLVVLVDHSSASASEIVSGAIQDHDRGLVVGETTFGKGLVQRVIPLNNGGALAVTTAKYYTPAGRLIQRDYTDLDDYYLNRDETDLDGEALPSASVVDPEDTTVDDREVYYTDAHRKVYGGGGITPDYIVKSVRYPELLLRMVRENLMFDFAVGYFAAHPGLRRGFEVDAALVEEYKLFLHERKFEYDLATFEEHQDLLAIRLRGQISRVAWDADAESAVTAAADPQIQRAIELFEEAQRMSRMSESAPAKPGLKG